MDFASGRSWEHSPKQTYHEKKEFDPATLASIVEANPVDYARHHFDSSLYSGPSSATHRRH
jgi:hypothetical protein